MSFCRVDYVSFRTQLFRPTSNIELVLNESPICFSIFDEVDLIGVSAHWIRPISLKNDIELILNKSPTRLSEPGEPWNSTDQVRPPPPRKE